MKLFENDRGEDDFEVEGVAQSDHYTAALRAVLDWGALRCAIRVFQLALQRNIDLPFFAWKGVLHALAVCGQIEPAISLVSDWKESEAEKERQGESKAEKKGKNTKSDLLHAILAGLIQSDSPDKTRLAKLVVDGMIGDDGDDGDADDDSQKGVNSRALALLVETYTADGAPGYLTEVGHELLKFKREHGVAPAGDALLAVCAAHLRSGDLDAAYRWFVAFQLHGDPGPSFEDAGTMELVSQLVRALAVSGQARRLLRVLSAVREAGGHLPASAAAVSLAGYTSGRTLATVWLEPPAELLRRRSLWSSVDGAVASSCAEQFEWGRLDSSRHATHQWSPYLAPDTKVERAWLTPISTNDHGSLGLARDWIGEGPAASAARERLGEGAGASRSHAKLGAALGNAVRMQMPQVGAFSLPDLRTWRACHADAKAGRSNEESSPQQGSEEILGKDLDAEVRGRLDEQLKEDEELPGTAADELKLAVKIAGLLTELEINLTAADLRAICAAAHAADEPEIAESAMRSLSEQLRMASVASSEEAAQVAERAATSALSATMSLGGWDGSSAEAFLEGQRPLPARAGTEGLGQLATRYIDPMLGLSLGSSNAERRHESIKILTDQLDKASTPLSSASPTRDSYEYWVHWSFTPSSSPADTGAQPSPPVPREQQELRELKKLGLERIKETAYEGDNMTATRSRRLKKLASKTITRRDVLEKVLAKPVAADYLAKYLLGDSQDELSVLDKQELLREFFGAEPPPVPKPDGSPGDLDGLLGFVKDVLEEAQAARAGMVKRL